MIEQIKKEIEEKYVRKFAFNDERQFIFYDDLLFLLDKYNNQPDFKGAWEELKNTTIFTKSYPREHKMSEYYKDAFEELEQKYNLGGE